MKADVLNRNDITEGVIWKQLLIFFFPILIGTFFQQLYNTADAIIVGRYLGKEALSAVGGTTGTLINLLVNFFVGLSSGATVIISQYYGGERYEDVVDSIYSALGIAIVGGTILMVVGIAAAPTALTAMNTPEDIIGYSLIYIRIYFSGMIVNMIYNVGAGILRAMGDSKRPLYFLIISCMVNIVLDLLFVAVFKMGISGAAIATVISQFISAVLVLLVLRGDNKPYQIQLKKIHINKVKSEKIFRIGLPAGIQSVMYGISNILIQSCINTFGTNTVAAWTAYSKIDGLFWMTMGAFGVSITTFVGQNYGAGKIERVKKGVVQCSGISMFAAIALSFILYFSSKYLFLLFTSDLVVIETGEKILKFLVPAYFTFVFIEILSGALRGMGDSLIPMIITGCGVCGLRIVWIISVVPFKNNVETILASYPISWAITSVLFIFYYNYFWKKHERKLQKTE